jgi:hypothetical protein
MSPRSSQGGMAALEDISLDYATKPTEGYFVTEGLLQQIGNISNMIA